MFVYVWFRPVKFDRCVTTTSPHDSFSSAVVLALLSRIPMLVRLREPHCFGVMSVEKWITPDKELITTAQCLPREGSCNYIAQ